MNYSQFLFSQLLQVHNEDAKVMPYDILFAKSKELYNSFEKSDYNTDLKSEYECIINFLRQNQTTITNLLKAN